MILYTNNKGEIMDVNYTDDATLNAVEVDDENNPFTNWSIEKICCYKVKVEDGVVKSYTPYVDTRLVKLIDRLDTKIANLESALIEVAESGV